MTPFVLVGNGVDQMGIVGKFIDWVLKRLLGNDYQMNGLTIGGTLFSVAALFFGAILLAVATWEFFRGKKKEAQSNAIGGVILVALGAVGLIIVTAIYNSSKNELGV